MSRTDRELVNAAFSAGYPVPATATMPAQDPSPGPVKRPSGLNGCTPSPTGPTRFTDASRGLPLLAAAAVAGALFLRRRGEHLSH